MNRHLVMASVLAVLAVAGAAPAAAMVPGGKGLVTVGPFQCEGLGTVTIRSPQGGSTGFTTTTGHHLVALSYNGTFTDLDGNVFTFSQTFGRKAGLATFTCAGTFVYPGEGTDEFTMEVAIVPPHS